MVRFDKGTCAGGSGQAPSSSPPPPRKASRELGTADFFFPEVTLKRWLRVYATLALDIEAAPNLEPTPRNQADLETRPATVQTKPEKLSEQEVGSLLLEKKKKNLS